MGDPTTFTGCRCPHCKFSLDEIDTRVTKCPRCDQPFDASAVWMTRREPGELNLPGWLRAFGWPFLMMAAGGTVMALKITGYWDILSRGMITLAAEILFSLGLIRFIFLLAMDGDE